MGGGIFVFMEGPFRGLLLPPTEISAAAHEHIHVDDVALYWLQLILTRPVNGDYTSRDNSVCNKIIQLM